MPSKKRLAFDPNSSGARHLARMIRPCETIDVVITQPFLRIAGERGTLQGTQHQAGERLNLPRGEGEQLIADGFAKPCWSA